VHARDWSKQHQDRQGAYMATPADRLHIATGLGARWSKHQRGRGVYASCLWPTMQCWGFLEGSRDFKARSTTKEHTSEVFVVIYKNSKILTLPPTIFFVSPWSFFFLSSFSKTQPKWMASTQLTT